MVWQKQKRGNVFSFVNIFLLSGFIFIIAVPTLAETGNNIPTATIPETQPTVPHGNEGAVPCQDPTGGSCVTPEQRSENGTCDINDPNYAQCIVNQNCFIGFGIELGLCGGGAKQQTFGGYLQKMYAFLLAFVAIAAFGGITYGGLLYVLSAGSVSSTDEAKKWIWNALIGLLITAISFILLQTINPDLITNFNLDLKKYIPQSSGSAGLPLDSSCDPNNDQCASGSACIPSPGGGGVCRPAAAKLL